MGGTKSGSWVMAIGVDAGRAFADEFPPPEHESLVFLGVSHYACLPQAVERIRANQIKFSDDPYIFFAEQISNTPDRFDMGSPVQTRECPFCQSNGPFSKEHIYPKWFLKELKSRGARFTRDGRVVKRFSGPTTRVCMDCNNNWMAVLEKNTKDVLLALVYETRLVDQREQAVLAFWAVKVALLLDASNSKPVVPRGFGHSLMIQKRPHRGMHVWVAAYNDGSDALAAHQWKIMAESDNEVIALCVTFAVGRVVFQVLIPFLEGTLAPLEDFGGSVLPIWPVQLDMIDWPPPYYFDRDSLVALAKRVYDNREPVEMRVTLTQAIRRRLQT
ncbi:MAG TPA: hypothetical protein VFU43_30375 [Streptosporangiaceae bacterium]|nr:hypothetical protein [Streptosporangiaceae bacterium]